MPETTTIEALNQPAIVIDISGPEIRAANAPARRLWGLSNTTQLPVALDPAMPALKRLTDHHLGGATENGSATLVFWTWAGAQSLRCTIRPETEAGAVRIVFEEAAIEGGSPDIELAPPLKNDQTQPQQSDRIDMQAMAHELRTPIGAIIALAEMIETEQFGPLGDPRYGEYARDIGDSARLSLGIVASSLEQDALDSDLLENFTELNLAELIQKCLRTVHQSARQAQVTLRQIVPGDLPILIASSPGLTQILLNLLTNAVKFTPEGGTVTVDALTTIEGGIRISVRDTGVGMTDIDANVLIADNALGAHHSTTRVTAGNTEPTATGEPRLEPRRGIGFSLVRRLADAMTAKFEISSTRGVGTNVVLTFSPENVIPKALPQIGTQNAE